MKIISICRSCHKELRTEITINPLNDIVLSVEPCGDIDCYNCKECEIEQLNEKLEEEIAILIKKNKALQEKE